MSPRRSGNARYLLPCQSTLYCLPALANNQNFTLMELLRIAHLPERRKALFSDIPLNSQTDLPTAIWQELLIHLGRINQALSTRGGTRTSTRPPAAPPASRSDARAIPLQSGAIFRPAVKQKSAIESMFTSVLDGPIQPTPQIVNKVKEIEGKVEKESQIAGQKALEWIERKPVSGPVLKNSTTWLDSNVWSQIGRVWAKRNIELSLGDMVIAQRIIDSRSGSYRDANADEQSSSSSR